MGYGKQCLLVWSCVEVREWSCLEKGIRFLCLVSKVEMVAEENMEEAG